MLRHALSTLLVFSLVAGSFPGVARAGDSEAVRQSLKARYQLSRMEVGNSALEGQVSTRGSVLVLQADRAPAKKLRFVQLNTKSPRFHVSDYARVVVARDGTLVGDQGDLTLPKGTRLRVLDLKVDRDQVHIFTHTAAPILLGDGKTGYGCTEFVFSLDPGVGRQDDVAAVTAEIDRVLRAAANG